MHRITPQQWHHVSKKAFISIMDEYQFPSAVATELWTFLPQDRLCRIQSKYFYDIRQIILEKMGWNRFVYKMPFLDVIGLQDVVHIIHSFLPEWDDWETVAKEKRVLHCVKLKLFRNKVHIQVKHLHTFTNTQTMYICKLYLSSICKHSIFQWVSKKDLVLEMNAYVTSNPRIAKSEI